MLISFLFSLLQFSYACTLEVSIDDFIGVGTSDYIQRADEKANERSCKSVLLKINTPGGDLQSTRKIVATILNSELPYLCIVYPAGAHAGSAGAIILQACHVNGAIKATNLGAATPVSAGQQEIPEDLRKKILNDTISWLEGITKTRERNLEFSREIITEAKAVSATEAEKLKAIDRATETLEDFLTFAQGREVKVKDGRQVNVEVGSLEDYSPDIRYKVLQIFADPEISYLIFLGSLGLLYFEFTHPGAIIPGVVGGLGLIVSLISFHKLDVQWGALALMLLGIFFFILEAFIPSFGALGIGGIIAFTIGGLLLYDADTGYALPLDIVITSSLVLGLLLFGISYLALKTLKVKRTAGTEDVIGQEVEVAFINAKNKRKGQVLWQGELWGFEADEEDLQVGDLAVVKGQKGLTLFIEKK